MNTFVFFPKYKNNSLYHNDEYIIKSNNIDEAKKLLLEQTPTHLISTSLRLMECKKYKKDSFHMCSKCYNNKTCYYCNKKLNDQRKLFLHEYAVFGKYVDHSHQLNEIDYDDQVKYIN